jgi:hypothetical protein
MVVGFKHLKDEKSFTDMTIACDWQSTKAHKMNLCLLSLFQGAAEGESCQAFHHHPEGCPLQTSQNSIGVHVRWQSECVPGPASPVFKDCREALG